MIVRITCVVFMLSVLVSFAVQSQANDVTLDFVRQSVASKFAERKDITVAEEFISWHDPSWEVSPSAELDLKSLNPTTLELWKNVDERMRHDGLVASSGSPLYSVWRSLGDMESTEKWMKAGEDPLSMKTAFDGSETRQLQKSKSQGSIVRSRTGSESGIGVKDALCQRNAENNLVKLINSPGAELISSETLVGNVKCVTVRAKDGEETLTLDLAPGFDWLPVRTVMTVAHNQTKREVVCSGFEQKDGFWFPGRTDTQASWVWPDGKRRTGFASVTFFTEVKFNQGLTKRDFHLEFPAGTRVFDSDSGIYIAGESSSAVEELKSDADKSAADVDNNQN